jgi:hypothetical protein
MCRIKGLEVPVVPGPLLPGGFVCPWEGGLAMQDLLEVWGEGANVPLWEVMLFLLLSAITYYRRQLSSNRVYMDPPTKHGSREDPDFRIAASTQSAVPMSEVLEDQGAEQWKRLPTKFMQELQHTLQKAIGQTPPNPCDIGRWDSSIAGVPPNPLGDCPIDVYRHVSYFSPVALFLPHQAMPMWRRSRASCSLRISSVSHRHVGA